MKINYEHDQAYLLKALSIGANGRGFCAPNPAVGAIIVNPTSGEIIATGYHTGPGKAHAEIEALKKMAHQAKGMTMYVTLEPCGHTGKTPPCTEAIIQSGITRVVYGFKDPNPLVAGKGVQLLKEAGISCEHNPLSQINSFYESYHHWHTTKQPYITAKIAMSLDGKIAGNSGERIQITGESLAEYTHYHRKVADAILTTAETVKKDDPRLNARYQNDTYAKQLYILDSQLTLSPDAAVFKAAQSVTLFHEKNAASIHQAAFNQLNVRCIPIDKNASGLDLQQVIQQIGQDGVHDLWVEAGGKCFSSFLKNQLVQRALIYLAPRWLGSGLSAFTDQFSLDNLRISRINWQQVGSDGVLDLRF